MLVSDEVTQKKNPAAVALGRKGGKKKVPKGFSALTAKERKANAIAAARARWGEKKADKKDS